MTAIFDSEPTLQQLEDIIERGLRVYTEVAAALQQIHERKLYRPAYGSFDAYCKTRWHFSAKRAYQLLTAARVAGQMSTTVDTGVPPPSNERQARQLARIADPVQRNTVWQGVVAEHGPSATSQDVQNAVDRHLAVSEITEREDYNRDEATRDEEAPDDRASLDDRRRRDTTWPRAAHGSTGQVSGEPTEVTDPAPDVRQVLVSRPAADGSAGERTSTTTVTRRSEVKRTAHLFLRSHTIVVATSLDEEGNVPEEVKRRHFEHELNETVEGIERLMMTFAPDWVGGWMASGVRTRLEPAIADLTRWAERVEDAAAREVPPALNPGEGAADALANGLS